MIDENDLARHITYRTRVERAAWSSDHRRWTVELLDLETDRRRQLTCGFLWMCQGYYEHRQGYTPEWEGMDRFRGPIVHPQQWPDDLDYEGKRVRAAFVPSSSAARRERAFRRIVPAHREREVGR